MSSAGSGGWRWLLAVLPFAGLAVALLLLLQAVDLRAVAAALAAARFRWLGAAIALVVLIIGGVSLKLRVVVSSVGLNPGLRRCWSAVMASLSLNAVLPGKGGDLAKAYFLCPRASSISPLIGAVMLERAVDVLVLGLLSMAGSLVAGFDGMVGVAAIVSAGALAAILALAYVSHFRRLPSVVTEAGRASAALLRKPVLAGSVLALSALVWTMVIVVFAALFAAVGLRIEPAAVMTSVPLAVLFGTLPISISGIGTRDGALVLLLGGVGEPAAILAAGFLYTAVAYWLPALLGLAALGSETLRKVRATAWED